MNSEQDQEHRAAKRTARRVARSQLGPARRHATAKRRSAKPRADESPPPPGIAGNDAKALGIAMIFTATLGLVVTTLLLPKRRRSES